MRSLPKFDDASDILSQRIRSGLSIALGRCGGCFNCILSKVILLLLSNQSPVGIGRARDLRIGTSVQQRATFNNASTELAESVRRPSREGSDVLQLTDDHLGRCLRDHWPTLGEHDVGYLYNRRNTSLWWAASC